MSRALIGPREWRLPKVRWGFTLTSALVAAAALAAICFTRARSKYYYACLRVTLRETLRSTGGVMQCDPEKKPYSL